MFCVTISPFRVIFLCENRNFPSLFFVTLQSEPGNQILELM